VYRQPSKALVVVATKQWLEENGWIKIHKNSENLKSECFDMNINVC
jgi:hypothetical protein